MEDVSWLGVGAALTAVVVASAFVTFSGRAEVKGKPITELGGGTLQKEEVQQGWWRYDTFFQQSPGQGVKDKSQAPEFVDTFYNLVTDIYEWGWGQSFHFSPAIPGKSYKESTRLHEVYVAELLKLKQGMTALDAGCGVGGPMRAIAQASKANIVGLTINQYQVDRATSHNERAGLGEQCTVRQGNFLEMPFEAATFDAAYSIEATCHAPRVEDVYAEIFRVLKPGALYVTYEWVKTKEYNPKDPQHVKIIDDICYGNALPELRSYQEVAVAAEKVGFEVLDNRDLAAPPALPWWNRLKMSRLAYIRNHLLVSASSMLGIAPKGLVDVHQMLANVAVSLSQGGETGIFSPAHLLLLRKPMGSS